MEFRKEINFAKCGRIISTSRLYGFPVTIGCGEKVVRRLTLKFSKAPEGLTN